MKKLGVLYWRLKGEEDPKLAAIREARGYSYKVDIAPLPTIYTVGHIYQRSPIVVTYMYTSVVDH